MLFLTNLLLQSGNAGLYNLIFIGAMIVIFWLFLIRPQQKKQKEQKSFSESLQKGDEVVTASGIIGRINKIDEQVVTLEVSNKTYIRVIRSAISREMTEAMVSGGDDDKDK
jgi:preprotein translocase subunit YajC